MSRQGTAGILAGVRVVELEGWLAGAVAGLLLADQGADVIKIQRPGAPTFDHPALRTADRGKRAVVLDLALDDDRDVASRLVASADVVIDNQRPGALARFGLDAAAIRSRDSRLIHLALPAFAGDDPEHGGERAYEGQIGAAVGLYTDINVLKALFGLDPVYTALPLSSIYAAVQGATATMAALYARERTGVGAYLEVSLASAAAMAMSSIYMKVAGQPPHYDAPQLPPIVKGLVVPAMRHVMKRSKTEKKRTFYERLQANLPALMTSYACDDGRLLYLFAVDNLQLAERTLAALDLLDEVRLAGFVSEDPYKGPSKSPNLAATSTLPPRASAWLKGRIAERLKTRNAADWQSTLVAAGVPCALQRSTEDWMADPELFAASVTIDVPRAEPGSSRQIGRQAWFDAAVDSPRPAPARDEHGDALRREVAGVVCQAARDVPRHDTDPTAPLAGLRVLDFSSMVAGPVAGRTLAELGADVIKVEAPAPRHGPRMTLWYGLDVNQAKRSIVLDLAKPEARPALRRLLAGADVVLHNFTPEAAARLGLDQPSVRQSNDSAVVCAVGAWGGPVSSNLDGRRGYDPVLQAASGIMVRYGSQTAPELHAIASCVDALTGYSAAFAVVAAIAANRRGASVRRACTGLAQAAQLIQLPFTGSPNGTPLVEPAGQDALGEGAAYSLQRVKDGWIFIAAVSPSELAALTRFSSARGGVEALSQLTKSAAIAALADAGAPATAVTRVAERSRLGGSFATVTRSVGPYTVTQLGPDWLRINGLRLPRLVAAAKPGEHTRAVLTESGLSPDEVSNVFTSGAARHELARSYLP